jgi:hypothetical protein
MSKVSKSESVPKDLQAKFEEVTSYINNFCQAHLNEEYAQKSRQLVATLARKRPSPLLTGKPNTWAVATLYTIGAVNFLFDKASTPYMKASELCQYFNLSSSTVTAKSKQIRDLLNIGVLDPDWTLPSRVDNNPMIWFLTVNGMPMDIRYAPVGAQIEAYNKGLIPYVPALQKLASEGETGTD